MFNPEPPVAVTVLDVDVPPIVPVPVAVILTFVPDSVPANDIPEFVPVFVRVTAPLVVSPVTVMPVPEVPWSINDSELGLFVVLEIDVFAESVMYTAPAVFRDIVGALVKMFAPLVPTVPDPVPVTKDSVPAVDMLVAACCVIVPVPLVVSVTELPVKFAFTAIVPFVPAVNDRAPVALIVLDAVIFPVVPAVSVKLKIAPVDALDIVTALVSLA
jgi:hypothetical protein